MGWLQAATTSSSHRRTCETAWEYPDEMGTCRADGRSCLQVTPKETGMYLLVIGSKTGCPLERYSVKGQLLTEMVKTAKGLLMDASRSLFKP